MAPRSVCRLEAPLSTVTDTVTSAGDGDLSEKMQGGRGCGSQTGPKEGCFCQSSGGGGLGGQLREDSSGGLGAGLPALALRFLPSLPGRRERGV